MEMCSFIMACSTKQRIHTFEVGGWNGLSLASSGRAALASNMTFAPPSQNMASLEAVAGHMPPLESEVDAALYCVPRETGTIDAQ